MVHGGARRLHQHLDGVAPGHATQYLEPGVHLVTHYPARAVRQTAKLKDALPQCAVLVSVLGGMHMTDFHGKGIVHGHWRIERRLPVVDLAEKPMKAVAVDPDFHKHLPL